jgi:predicted Ser/Thr protein kinase
MQPSPFPSRCAAKFEAQRLLAAGGFASVYLARQRGLDRPVAVKLLFDHLLDEVDEVARFRDEARITASFHHPHIVTVIDHDVESGVPWIAYEYLPGHTLRDVLRAGALAPRKALATAIQIAWALEEVHAQGILHRDVKPENVLEAADGVYKLADFGIAKWARGSRTRTGKVPGTLLYVAPELIEGKPPSERSDVYALGILFHEMLTGRTPFEGQGPLAICKGHLEQPVPPVSASVAGVPSAVDRILFAALAKEPERRLASARALREALESVQLDTPSVVRRVVPRAMVPTPVLGLAHAPKKRVRSGHGRRVAAVAAVALGLAGLFGWRAPLRATAPSPATTRAMGAAMERVAAAPRPPVDRKLSAELESLRASIEVGRRGNLDVVTRLAPLTSQAQLEEAVLIADRQAAEHRVLAVRIQRAVQPVLDRAPDPARAPLAELVLHARARALVFGSWARRVCLRRMQDAARWATKGSTLLPQGWLDGSSPMLQPHYSAEGVPLLVAYLDACTAALARSVGPGARPGPEVAELLDDLFFVAWYTALSDWEPRANDLLAPAVKRFKARIGELEGREGLAMRWTVWCMWSWTEAGRAQTSGRFYRKNALDGLRRLQSLVPAARDALERLADRLTSVWGDPGSRA